MPRTIPTLAAVLAALTIAAPAAPATPVETSSPAATTASPEQDLWSPGAYPPPPWVPRQDAARPKSPSDLTAALLAQERYYSSSGDPTPITPSAAPEIRTDDGIARLPFILAISGALIIGLATGSVLHLLHVRRRHATGLAT